MSGVISGKTHFFSDRLELLDIGTKIAQRDGIWVEFGVYRGESINFIAKRTNRVIYGFDSFWGLPEDWTPTHPAGTFSTRGELPPVRENVSLVPGLFASTLPDFLKSVGDNKITFMHVDCDLYSSSKLVLKMTMNSLTKGSVIVFDEFCGLTIDDEARAFREEAKARNLHYSFIGCSQSGAVCVLVD